MDIDKMHHRLREQLLNEQNLLTRQHEPHGHVYYFSREITACQKDLRPFHVTRKHQDPNNTYAELNKLFQQNNSIQPEIEIICGKAGVGKTHRINTNYKNDNTLCFSINDKLNLSLLTSSLLSYDSITSDNKPSVYFNISVHAPFEELTRTLFSLFVCGSLVDSNSGFTFSLPSTKSWRFIIEIPHTDEYNMTTKQTLAKILPILSIMSLSTLDEVTDKNYQLFIGDEEELIARFLKAYDNKSINRILTYDKNRIEYPVYFDRLTDSEECRQYIYNCLDTYAPELSKNKVSELSFIKFLYRRIRFFTGHYYQMNDYDKHLGSRVMKQMIHEAKSLAHIDFQHSDYPRIYLVYDPSFSLHLLHDGWDNVPHELKEIFNNHDPSLRPEFKNKDYFIKCLSWLIDIKYDDFEQIMNEIKFILTENFAYKLFHVHERKLTKLPLIIEGETGVGKTFLLKFYSLLLNSKIIKGSLQDNIAQRIVESTSLWLLNTIIVEILEKELNILEKLLRRLKPKLAYGDELNTMTDVNEHYDIHEDEKDNNFQRLFLSNEFEYDDGSGHHEMETFTHTEIAPFDHHLNDEERDLLPHDLNAKEENLFHHDLNDEERNLLPHDLNVKDENPFHHDLNDEERNLLPHDLNVKEENLFHHDLNDEERNLLPHDLNDKKVNPSHCNLNDEGIDPFRFMSVDEPVPCRIQAKIDSKLLKEIKDSLANYKYKNDMLKHIWKMIMSVSDQNSQNITQKLIQELCKYVTSQLISFPLIEARLQLKSLLTETSSISVQTCVKIFDKYLFFTQTEPLFYRLLLHPGVTEEQLEQFLRPISQLARQLPNIELVVFFDEVNTSSCLGLFKEIFIDRTLHGINLPKNIFFTGCINPAVMEENNDNQVHRQDYRVHQLPESLQNLKVSYGILESKILEEYIIKKIAMFHIEPEKNSTKKMPLEQYAQEVLANSILTAQEFCEKYL
ncbi:unnamed protein product, partial [Didymodactylos carnosus]